MGGAKASVPFACLAIIAPEQATALTHAALAQALAAPVTISAAVSNSQVKLKYRLCCIFIRSFHFPFIYKVNVS